MAGQRGSGAARPGGARASRAAVDARQDQDGGNGRCPMTRPPHASTADVVIPGPLIEQVIGQERAAGVIRLAAGQRRAVLLVGEPGTGKSMLAAAMAELMPAAGLEDVVIRANPKARLLPRIERLPAGEGTRVVAAEQARLRREPQGVSYLTNNTVSS